MKISIETLAVSRCEVAFLSAGGAIVGCRKFMDFDSLRWWLGYLKVVLSNEDTSVRALYAHKYPVLKEFSAHACADGSLRFNILIGGCCLSPGETIVLAERSACERAAAYLGKRAAYRFRDGPVPRTGKGGSYCYFRRGMRTFDSHREASEVCDDDDFRGCTPSVRAARNIANLPSGRDDIGRCIQHSWKKTRRHQWKEARR